jgi:hypothetical protein
MDHEELILKSPPPCEQNVYLIPPLWLNQTDPKNLNSFKKSKIPKPESFTSDVQIHDGLIFFILDNHDGMFL